MDYIRLFPSSPTSWSQKNFLLHTQTLTLVVWSLCAIYLVLQTISLAYAFFNGIHKRDLSHPISRFLATWYLLHSRVIFFHIQKFLTKIINQDENGSEYPLNAQLTSKNAWLAASVVLTILNLSPALIKELLFAQTINETNPYASKTNVYHSIVLMYKILAIFVPIFNSDLAIASKCGSMLHLVFSVSLVYVLCSKMPFYKFKVLKATVIMTAIFLSLSITLIVQVFAENKQVGNSSQVLLVLLPILMVKIFLSTFKILFDRIINTKLTSAENAIHFALLYQELTLERKESSILDKSFFPDLEMMHGALSRQNINPLALIDKEDEANRADAISKLYAYILKKLQTYASSSQKPQVLLLYMARKYFKELDNLPKCIELMQRVETSSPFILNRAIILDIYTQIELEYGRKHIRAGKSLGLYEYINYSGQTSSMKTKMVEEIEKHISFWTKLKSNNIDVKHAACEAEEIDTLSSMIKNLYHTNFKDCDHRFPVPFLVYGLYLHIVRNQSYEASLFIKKFKSTLYTHDVRCDLDIYNGTSASIVISLDKKRLGEVTRATASVQSVYGITRTSLLGNNFGSLFPSMLAKTLHQLVQQYANSFDSKLSHSYRTYGRMANGHIIEVDVSFHLYITRSYEIAVLMITNKISDILLPMVIVNAEGKIIDYSKSLQDDLGRENIDVKTFRSIQDISPEFEAINSAFNSVYSIFPEATWFISASPSNQKRLTKPNNLLDPEDLLSCRPKLLIESEVNTAAIVSDTREEDFPFLGAVTKNTPQSMRILTSPFKPPANSEVPDVNDASKNLKTSSYSVRVPLNIPSFSELSINRNKSSSIPLEKAQVICQQFLEGRTLVFYSAAQQARKSRFTIDIQVKPHILEGDACKVIILKNLRKDMSSVKKSEVVFFKDGEFSNRKYMDENAIVEESFIDHSAGASTQKRLLFIKNNEERPLIPPNTPDSDDIPPIKTFGLGPGDNFDDLLETKTEAALKKQSYLHFTNKEAKAARIIDAISTNKKLQPALKFSMVGVCFMMALIIALLSFNLYYSKAAIQETGLSVQLVYIVAQRLRYTMKLWQVALFFYSYSIGATYYSPATIKMYQASLLTNVEYLIAANNLLRNELPFLEGSSFFDVFSLDSVKMWTPLKNGTTYREFDTFTAHDLIAGKYVEVSRLADIADITKIDDIMYTLNNTANDVMMLDTKIISETFINLQEVIKARSVVLRTVLALEITGMICLGFVLLALGAVLVRSYNRMFRALVKIDVDNISDRIDHISKLKNLLQEDVESKSFLRSAFRLLNHQEKTARRIINDKDSKAPRKNDTFTVREMILYLLRAIAISLLLIPVFIVILEKDLQISTTKFDTFVRTMNQISVLNTASFEADMLVAAYAFEVSFWNRTDISIYEMSGKAQVYDSLNGLSHLSLSLSEAFLQGDIDPFIGNAFKNEGCVSLWGIFPQECEAATRGGQSGVLTIINDYVEIAGLYIDKYYHSVTSYQQSLASLSQLNVQFGGAVYSDMIILKNIFFVLINHIVADFSNKLEGALHQKVVLAFAIYGVALAYMLYLYLVPIKRLKTCDLARRKIIKIIPYHIIQKNRRIAFYLVKDFPKEAEGISTLLS